MQSLLFAETLPEFPSLWAWLKLELQRGLGFSIGSLLSHFKLNLSRSAETGHSFVSYAIHCNSSPLTPLTPRSQFDGPLKLLLVVSSFSPDGLAIGPVRRNMVTPHVTPKATAHSCRNVSEASTTEPYRFRIRIRFIQIHIDSVLLEILQTSMSVVLVFCSFNLHEHSQEFRSISQTRSCPF